MKSSAEWWKSYGASAPHLRDLAIKVLSLTCRSSSCERNWSTFENIHSKKKNKLDHQRLNDLVYIKYNQVLKERFDNRDVIDPISLKDIDKSNEWLLGRMEEDENAENELIFQDDDLTWDDLADTSRVGDPVAYTSSTLRNVSSGSGSQSRKTSSATIDITLRRNVRVPLFEVEEEEEFNAGEETGEE